MADFRGGQRSSLSTICWEFNKEILRFFVLTSQFTDRVRMED